ncbi:hypothetical protein [Vandammella animalimorsus]|uniref:hypothetical protein n=1 Tax=Vandammella animalimorsus TaxID=2029117 RepID=UPI001552E5B1|nr:hypothetical protein [Vandammella animalimorsus]
MQTLLKNLRNAPRPPQRRSARATHGRDASQGEKKFAFVFDLFFKQNFMNVIS